MWKDPFSPTQSHTVRLCISDVCKTNKITNHGKKLPISVELNIYQSMSLSLIFN
uniref:Uncharacterized protein n=1 Tax=Anguilla anguilla TaxID=7936 RepID=A0A0E9TRP9_ANGAN